MQRVFALCGDHINAVYRALALESIEIVSTRSESGVVHMADAWARTSGQVGVAIVTGCPGHTNALTGMSVANNAGTPLLIISGFTPPDQRERGGSQVLQQGQLAAPVTKWALEVLNPRHLGEYVAKAFQIALSGTPDPVSLSVPSDILDDVIKGSGDAPDEHTRDVLQRTMLHSASVMPETLRRDAATLLQAAQRPVLICGSGVRYDADAAKTAAIARTLGMPVFTIDQARGLIPDDGELCFGYADPFFSRTFREIVRADLIVLAGASIDFHTCFGRQQLLDPAVRIIQFSQDARLINQCRQSDLAVLGAPVAGLRVLAEVTQAAELKNRWAPWLGSLREAYASHRTHWGEMLDSVRNADKTIHPLQLCASLARHQTADTGIMIDAGDFVHWPRGYFQALGRARWMDAVLIGNLGGSIPLGIGSQMAHGKGQTWTFIGDGGFGFYAWDLEVAVEHQLPLKIIVGNDAMWGVEKRLQLNAYGEHVGCKLREIRYDKFAEMMGATGIHVDNTDDLDAAVDRLVSVPGPAVLNVLIRDFSGRPLADFKRY